MLFINVLIYNQLQYQIMLYQLVQKHLEVIKNFNVL